ncbi:hypothetical protein GGI19_000757 [Coemansia pectinata]|uniref:Elongation of fatty acids protein n=1 Tax=Coemansia pectinata TaxID=1052879 RepID=A0A9W8GZH2_9FUNG|nr:hypothetical protein GGI19_000757 [Coemansia pectinata]
MAAIDIVSLFTRSTLLPGSTVPVADIPLGGMYHAMMRPYSPVLGICAYLAMVKIWERRNARQAIVVTKGAGPGSTRNSQGTGSAFKAIIIAHNLVLAAYSIWTFVDFFPAVLRNVQMQGLKDGFCDNNWALRNDKLLVHGFLFYLSKYYEFIDTAIILAKGRTAGRLQTFHHSGAVLIMWLGNYVQSPYLAFFVFENSIIHSLMYTYYTLTALGFKPPGKQILTRLQISQFYVALSAGAVYSVLPGCQSGPQKLFTYIFIAYILELIRLFTEFARKAYGVRQPPPTLAVKKEA